MHLKNNMLFSVYDNNIFPFFCELNVFSRENSNFKIILNIGPLQRMTRMTKRVSRACTVDKGDRVTLAEKFACKPGLTLTHLLYRVTLAQG